MIQFKFAPYGRLACPDTAVIAFDIGRRLQRLWFHLQQAWLLADGAGILPSELLGTANKTASQLRWIASQRQFKAAHCLLNRLSLAVHLLKIEIPRRLSQEVDSARETLIDQAFPDRCYEVFEDLREDYRPGYRDDCFHDFVERLIEPGFEKLRHAIRDSLVGIDKQTFAAGMILEEGLSRADILRFLPPPNAKVDELNHHLELDDEAIRKLEAIEGKPLQEFDTYAVGAPVGSCAPEPHTGQRIDHMPGAILPQATWPERLHIAWRSANLPTDEVENATRAILTNRRPRVLTESVESLYGWTCRTLARSIGGDRLHVDVENCTVTLDGASYDVEKQVAILFAEWLGAPNGRMSFSQIRKKHSDHFAANDRLDRILRDRELPARLARIVISGKGQVAGIQLSQR